MSATKSALNIQNEHLRFLFRDRVISAALFLMALGLFALEWRYSLSNGFLNLKGGVSTVGAERVLNGDLPYRDFWTMYAPGHFYLLALLFRLFGHHLLVEVIAASFVSATVAVVVYMLARKLFDNQLYAIIPAGIFLGVMYNTEYFKRLGSYPPAILLVFLAMYLMTGYYETGRVGYLFGAGIAISMVIIFKHDVGGYTAIALTVGLIIHYIVEKKSGPRFSLSIWRRLLVFAGAVSCLAVPVMTYFAVRTWPDMLQDLVIFPLTDFRYARPEGYPRLLPLGLLADTPLQTLNNLFTYISFNIPFLLFLSGLIAVGIFVRKRQPVQAAMGATFALAYFLHYTAAHVQINTHIISMSVYATLLGIMAYELPWKQVLPYGTSFLKIAGLTLILGWLLSVAAKPTYSMWTDWRTARANVFLPKVSGFKVAPHEAQTLQDLADFVDQHIPSDQPLFVGLHRHDVVVIGDILIYFILDRPIATRYQELHPAIADTQPVQQEIIRDLQNKDVNYIILRQIFSDQVLNRVKQDFLKNLPYIGAMDLDNFIRGEYVQVERFGPYTVWQRKLTLSSRTSTFISITRTDDPQTPANGVYSR